MPSGVFPALNPLGVDDFKVTNSAALGSTVLLHVLDETATGCSVACYTNNMITLAGLCKGEFNASNQTITWTGGINEVWTYMGSETLQQTVTDRVVFGVGQLPEVLGFVEADTAIESTLYNLTEQDWTYVNASGSQFIRVVCNPTDLYPFSFRKKATGELLLSPFQMRRRKLLFQPGTAGTPDYGSYMGNVIGIDTASYLAVSAGTAPGSAQFALSKQLVTPKFDLVLQNLRELLSVRVFRVYKIAVFRRSARPGADLVGEAEFLELVPLVISPD